MKRKQASQHTKLINHYIMPSRVSSLHTTLLTVKEIVTTTNSENQNKNQKRLQHQFN